MQRITPEIVKEAYTKTGMKPARRMFLQGNCACGIGVMLVAKCGVAAAEVPSDKESQDFMLVPRMEKEFGKKYSFGFTRGFDGKPLIPECPPDSGKPWETEEWQLGHSDGQACALAVFCEAQST